MNTIQKMYRSNSKAKKWLKENGYENIHLFPHTRYIKDVTIDKANFDGIATKGQILVLFQIKSNKKPSKINRAVFRNVSQKYGIDCLWINIKDNGGVCVFK